MEKIQFRCPSCDKLLRVASSSAGKRVRCPECNYAARVPSDDEDADDDGRQRGPAVRASERTPVSNLQQRYVLVVSLVAGAAFLAALVPLITAIAHDPSDPFFWPGLIGVGSLWLIAGCAYAAAVVVSRNRLGLSNWMVLAGFALGCIAVIFHAFLIPTTRAEWEKDKLLFFLPLTVLVFLSSFGPAILGLKQSSAE